MPTYVWIFVSSDLYTRTLRFVIIEVKNTLYDALLHVLKEYPFKLREIYDGNILQLEKKNDLEISKFLKCQPLILQLNESYFYGNIPYYEEGEIQL